MKAIQDATVCSLGEVILWRGRSDRRLLRRRSGTTNVQRPEAKFMGKGIFLMMSLRAVAGTVLTAVSVHLGATRTRYLSSQH